MPESDVIVTLRLTAAEAADLDRLRGGVKRGSWIKQRCRDAVLAHDGLARIDSEPEVPAARTPPERRRAEPPRTEVPLPKIARRHWG